MSTAFADQDVELAVLSPSQSAKWALRLLQEYASKLIDFNQRCHDIHGKMLEVGAYAKLVAPIDAARMIQYHDAIKPKIESVIRQASGLLEHAHIAIELELELKLRLDETEEHLRFSKALSEKLAEELHGRKDLLSVARSILNKNRIVSSL